MIALCILERDYTTQPGDGENPPPTVAFTVWISHRSLYRLRESDEISEQDLMDAL